jgi:hypothetical protein
LFLLFALWNFTISHLGPAMLFYDFASWRRLLIRDSQFPSGSW